MKEEKGPVTVMLELENEKLISGGTANVSIKIWNLQDYSCLKSIDMQLMKVYDILQMNANLVMIVTNTSLLHYLNIDTGVIEKVLHCNEMGKGRCAVILEAGGFVIADHNGALKIFE